jgi:hypothetical protein
MQHSLAIIVSSLTAVVVSIPPVGRPGSSFFVASTFAAAAAVARPDDRPLGPSDPGAKHTPHVRGASSAGGGPAVLPPNLQARDNVLPLVRTMWLRSPTFRRQCARLGENPFVIVTIGLTTHASNGRAESHMSRHDNRTSATIEIDFKWPDLFVEHIAHELEHILEDIDGVDHLRLAREGLDGIVKIGETYETARARAVGRKVAREVRFQ